MSNPEQNKDRYATKFYTAATTAIICFTIFFVTDRSKDYQIFKTSAQKESILSIAKNPYIYTLEKTKKKTIPCRQGK